MANNLKGYDANQVLRSVFEVDKNCLRVCVVEGSTGDGSGFEVIITHTSDSIRIGDGTSLTTVSQVGLKYGLDVNVLNEIDISPLSNTTDSVAIGDGSQLYTGGEFTDIGSYALDTLSINSLVRVRYDDVEVTDTNTDGDPTEITFRSMAVNVAVLAITYDADGNFQRVQVTYV